MTSSARQPGMGFIMVAVLIDMISTGIIVPVLPLVVGTLTQSPTEQTFWFGVVAFTFGFANFLASPVLGALSDHWGRRPVLLLGMLGLAFSLIVTGLATALWMMIAARVVSGALQANVSVANAYVADITPAEQRAQRFGLLGAMFGVGFTIGPVIGGILGDIDVQLPFLVAGAIALVNAAYGYFVLPESLSAQHRRPMNWRSVNPIAALGGLRRLEGIAPLVVVIALTTLAMFTLHSSWVLYTHFKFGWGPWEIGASLFVVGVTNVLVQGFALKHLLRRFSPHRLAGMGLCSAALSYLGYALATEAWMVFSIIVVGQLLGGSAQAAMTSIISNAAPDDAQGSTMGAVASLNSLMAVGAPVLSALALGAVAHLPRGSLWIGLPFMLCAALQAAAAVLAIRHFHRTRGSRRAASPSP